MISDDLSLADVETWRVLRKRRRLILSAVTVTLAAAAAWLETRPPEYRTKAVVKVEADKAAGSLLQNILNQSAFFDIQGELTLLQSAEFRQKVADRMGWGLARVMGGYHAAKLAGQTASIIEITGRGADPVAAADLANTAAAVFVEEKVAARKRLMTDLIRELESRRTGALAAVRRLELEKRTFLQDYYAKGLDGNTPQAIAALESTRRDLLARFTPDHPEVGRLDARIRNLRDRLALNPVKDEELGRLNRDMHAQNELANTLQRQIAESRFSLDSIPPSVMVLSQAPIPVNPSGLGRLRVYGMALGLGLALACVLAVWIENLDTTVSTLEAAERVLGLPVLGVVPFMGGGWPGRLGRLAWLWNRKRRGKPGDLRAWIADPETVEASSKIFSGILNEAHGRLDRRRSIAIAVTSAVVSEGKTQTSLNMALAASSMGLRTLLVGTDIHRQSLSRGIHASDGLRRVLFGESALQAETSSWSEVAARLRIANWTPGGDLLSVLAGWKGPVHGAYTVFLSRLPGLLLQWRAMFDVVILDCAPVLLATDAIPVASAADGAILVYKVGLTPYKSVLRARNSLLSFKARVVGVVLNGMPAREYRAEYYDYRYPYGYYRRQPVSDEAAGAG